MSLSQASNQRALRRSGLRIALRCLTTCLLLFALAPLPAQAIDNAKIAGAMVQQAAKAFEVGDFVKAADLYQKAYRLDARPAYLWAMARAEHLAGQAEGAIEHYRIFIATPGSEVARVPKAQAYLKELAADQARVRVREAEAATRAGNARNAADFYLAAAKLMPDQPEHLFHAAIEEARDGQDAAAIQHFDAYLAQAPAAAPDRAQAEARVAALRAKGGPARPTAAAPVAAPVAVPVAPAAPVAEPRPIAVAQAPAAQKVHSDVVVKTPPAPVPWPAWAAMGGGALLAGGGVALLLGAQADAAQLDADQAHPPGQVITRLSFVEATTRASDINNRAAIGWALSGAGVVAAGVGTWMLLSQPAKKIVLLPTAGGALLAGRF